MKIEIDEAIKHCEEAAEENEHICNCYPDFGYDKRKYKKRAAYHRQLAECLKKLKAYEEAREEIIRTRDSGHMERTCCDGLNHAIYIIDKHFEGDER